ncbi:MAG: 2-oxoacid:acceptor oxidoreductase subunit alpha [candidate division WOR-3 bacterium]
MELNIIVSGQAGQGIQILTEILGRALVRNGYHVFASMDAMSRIRGGHNFSRIRVSDKQVGANAGKAQLLIALDPAQILLNIADLELYGVVLTDDSVELAHHSDYQLTQLPLTRTALEAGKNKVMQNVVAAGAVFALLNLDLTQLIEIVKERLGTRSIEAAERSVTCIQQGYELAQRRARKGILARLKPVEATPRRLFLSGAQAIALGAVAGGVRFVAGYPMSPGTPVVEACAAWQDRVGLVVEQPEDEIAAINMAIGSSFAGALGMVVTAGGGLCLMNEALSLAGMTETPVVVCSGMRPGPATGMATRTAQADLLFAISCGHGEFPRAVLCPADALQAFEATSRACRIAAQFQTPVIVLFDQLLADALWTIDEPDLSKLKPVSLAEIGQPDLKEAYSYRRYELTESGVSPLILPGTMEQLVYADSDEHTIEGHITESATVRNQMVSKRMAKLHGIAASLEPPWQHRSNDAETIVFCFGSTKATVKQAVDKLRSNGYEVGMVHLCDLWPFPAEAVFRLIRHARRFVTVENNWSGQLAKLITQETGLRICGSARKYDGRPFLVEEVEQGIMELLQ